MGRLGGRRASGKYRGGSVTLTDLWVKSGDFCIGDLLEQYPGASVRDIACMGEPLAAVLVTLADGPVKMHVLRQRHGERTDELVKLLIKNEILQERPAGYLELSVSLKRLMGDGEQLRPRGRGRDRD
jgi:hypothetical protein